jgi:hypothetical protein
MSGLRVSLEVIKDPAMEAIRICAEAAVQLDARLEVARVFVLAV